MDTDSERLVIRELEQTCQACPSQWEATLDDGRMLYFRYRWGCLTIEASEQPTKDVMDAIGGKIVFDQQIGDEMDGFINQDELIKLTEHLIEYPAQ